MITRRTPEAHPVALIQLEQLTGAVAVAVARIDVHLQRLANNRQACDALLDVRNDLRPPKPAHPER